MIRMETRSGSARSPTFKKLILIPNNYLRGWRTAHSMACNACFVTKSYYSHSTNFIFHGG
jgi:hypothetical protein